MLQLQKMSKFTITSSQHVYSEELGPKCPNDKTQQFPIASSETYINWAQSMPRPPFALTSASNRYERTFDSDNAPGALDSTPPLDQSPLLRGAGVQLISGSQTFTFPSTHVSVDIVESANANSNLVMVVIPYDLDKNPFHSWVLENRIQVVYTIREALRLNAQQLIVAIDATSPENEKQLPKWAIGCLSALSSRVMYSNQILSQSSALQSGGVSGGVGRVVMIDKTPMPAFAYDRFEVGLHASQISIDTANAILTSLNIKPRSPHEGGYVVLVDRHKSRHLVDKHTLTLQPIIDEMCKLGLDVRVVSTEDIAFSKQVEVVAGATVMVAVHGAGITNSVFMLPNDHSHVIEITMRYGWCCDPIVPESAYAPSTTKMCTGPCKVYHKMDFANLVRLSGVRYWYYDPVFVESRTWANPIESSAVHVDAKELAQVTKVVYQKALSGE
eukprot:c2983_g1_i1.p1 GENE.c2983_g1_i1~~c2983_g1_i1.p1  ORF type:complete len:443 (-),score=127.69 c2983_g1_i1:310-1638(-)